jgi:transcription-repair coupling factor (superfamily II helicase)
LKNILNKFQNLNFTKNTSEIVNKTNDDFGIKILYGAAKSLFIAALSILTNKKFLVITPNNESYADFVDDLNLLIENEKVFQLQQSKKYANSHYKNLLENDTSNAELIAKITQFQSKNSTVAVATTDIFHATIPNPNVIKNHLRTVKKKQIIDIQQFTTQLSLNGFQKEQYVSKAGEYAVRGGIIDVFAPNMKDPIRIELWGDEIESIRNFDALSQRSKNELNEIEFIDSIFIADNENADTNVFEFIKNDTIIVIDSPDSIDFSDCEAINNYRKIFLNPLGNFSDVND